VKEGGFLFALDVAWVWASGLDMEGTVKLYVERAGDLVVFRPEFQEFIRVTWRACEKSYRKVQR
jgi:hypothetical protein